MHKTVLIFFLVLIRIQLTGQSVCPANIGFELGSFQNWECSMGSISSDNGTISLDPSQPSYGRHSLLQNTFPQTMLDIYGDFPVTCPNGSGYSIQLGNNMTGKEAERVSYTFTIPLDQNDYSIIYNYAVVFQNPADHSEWQQPKFIANVFDVTNDTYIGCSSFSYAASSNLPGFKKSPLSAKDDIFYKPWTPVTIKLSGYAGRTIRLEFTTNDCTKGGHFGYAYIDVNQNCASPVSGNIYCTDAKSLTLIAPFGFGGYKWFPADFSKVLGTANTLHLDPTPPVNKKYAVEVTPFENQGCIDTVYTTVQFSPHPLDLKVVNAVGACISTGLDLTAGRIIAGSTPNLIYSYYMDLSQINYVPSPKYITKTGTYYIQASNSVGCTDIKKVAATIYPLPVFRVTDPAPAYRPTTIDLSKTISTLNGLVFNYSYWKDTLASTELLLPEFVDKSGTYFIQAAQTKQPDCTTTEPVHVIMKEPLILAPNVFSPNGDGIHDEWYLPQLSYYPECIVTIYNRTGQLVFHSAGYSKPWDGKSNGKALPVATYYYVIKLNAELPSLAGGITIIR
jgi:gliding motility-associated-like protein